MTGHNPGAGRPRSRRPTISAVLNMRAVTPLERTGQANAHGTTDVGAIIATFKQRSSSSAFKGAVICRRRSLAEFQWHCAHVDASRRRPRWANEAGPKKEAHHALLRICPTRGLAHENFST